MKYSKLFLFTLLQICSTYLLGSIAYRDPDLQQRSLIQNKITGSGRIHKTIVFDTNVTISGANAFSLATDNACMVHAEDNQQASIRAESTISNITTTTAGTHSAFYPTKLIIDENSTTITDHILIEANVIINGDLTVNGDLVIDGDLTVKGAVSIESGATLVIKGDALLDGDNLNAIDIEGTIDVRNNKPLPGDSSQEQEGSTTRQGNLIIKNTLGAPGLRIDGALTTSGSILLENNRGSDGAGNHGININAMLTATDTITIKHNKGGSESTTALPSNGVSINANVTAHTIIIKENVGGNGATNQSGGHGAAINSGEIISVRDIVFDNNTGGTGNGTGNGGSGVNLTTTATAQSNIVIHKNIGGDGGTTGNGGNAFLCQDSTAVQLHALASLTLSDNVGGNGNGGGANGAAIFVGQTTITPMATILAEHGATIKDNMIAGSSNGSVYLQGNIQSNTIIGRNDIDIDDSGGGALIEGLTIGSDCLEGPITSSTLTSPFEGDLCIIGDFTLDSNLTVNGNLTVMDGNIDLQTSNTLTVSGSILFDGFNNNHTVVINGNIHGATSNNPGAQNITIINYTSTTSGVNTVTINGTITATETINISNNTGSNTTATAGTGGHGVLISQAFSANQIILNNNTGGQGGPSTTSSGTTYGGTGGHGVVIANNSSLQTIFASNNITLAYNTGGKGGLASASSSTKAGGTGGHGIAIGDATLGSLVELSANNGITIHNNIGGDGGNGADGTRKIGSGGDGINLRGVIQSGTIKVISNNQGGALGTIGINPLPLSTAGTDFRIVSNGKSIEKLTNCYEANTITTSSNFTSPVTESVCIIANLTVDNALEIEGDLTVQGNVVINQALTVHGDLTITGALDINANLRVKGNLTARRGDILLDNNITLTVDNDIFFDGQGESSDDTSGNFFVEFKGKIVGIDNTGTPDDTLPGVNNIIIQNYHYRTDDGLNLNESAVSTDSAGANPYIFARNNIILRNNFSSRGPAIKIEGVSSNQGLKALGNIHFINNSSSLTNTSGVEIQGIVTADQDIILSNNQGSGTGHGAQISLGGLTASRELILKNNNSTGSGFGLNITTGRQAKGLSVNISETTINNDGTITSSGRDIVYNGSITSSTDLSGNISDNIKIQGSLTVDEDLTLQKDVIINGSLTVNAGHTLTINKDLIVQRGFILIESGATLTVNGNILIDGEGTSSPFIVLGTITCSDMHVQNMRPNISVMTTEGRNSVYISGTITTSGSLVFKNNIGNIASGNSRGIYLSRSNISAANSIIFDDNQSSNDIAILITTEERVSGDSNITSPLMTSANNILFINNVGLDTSVRIEGDGTLFTTGSNDLPLTEVTYTPLVQSTHGNIEFANNKGILIDSVNSLTSLEFIGIRTLSGDIIFNNNISGYLAGVAIQNSIAPNHAMIEALGSGSVLLSNNIGPIGIQMINSSGGNAIFANHNINFISNSSNLAGGAINNGEAISIRQANITALNNIVFANNYGSAGQETQVSNVTTSATYGGNALILDSSSLEAYNKILFYNNNGGDGADSNTSGVSARDGGNGIDITSTNLTSENIIFQNNNGGNAGINSDGGTSGIPGVHLKVNSNISITGDTVIDGDLTIESNWTIDGNFTTFNSLLVIENTQTLSVSKNITFDGKNQVANKSVVVGGTINTPQDIIIQNYNTDNTSGQSIQIQGIVTANNIIFRDNESNSDDATVNITSGVLTAYNNLRFERNQTTGSGFGVNLNSTSLTCAWLYLIHNTTNTPQQEINDSSATFNQYYSNPTAALAASNIFEKDNETF